MAADHHERKVAYQANRSPDAAPLPSIVVCPPTLTQHWIHEIKKFCDSLQSVCYVGPVKERRALLDRLDRVDVIVVSYDVLRNDLDQFVHRRFNYCVLDEGHIIRSPHTKITQVGELAKARGKKDALVH